MVGIISVHRSGFGFDTKANAIAHFRRSLRIFKADSGKLIYNEKWFGDVTFKDNALCMDNYNLITTVKVAVAVSGNLTGSTVKVTLIIILEHVA